MMLGITTSDAIALGSMIAALTAVCAGLVKGDRARAEASVLPSVVAVPDRETLRGLNEALGDLTDVLRTGVAILRAVSPPQ